ncbi:MAG: phosphotransferase, partial [Chloroflexia bacterium]|nr:phosphotransferase [Chloroflexia bacterium]
MTQAKSSKCQRGDISPDGRHYWAGDVWQWQPFWLDAVDVAEAVRQEFGRTVINVRFLAAGMLNQSWHVETTHRSYVLRISRRERSRAQVAYEHEFLGQLMGHVEEVVAPLAGNDG